MIDLRLGPWQDALEGVTCDAMIPDPPYGAKTHGGHRDGVVNGNAPEDGATRRVLDYGHLTPRDVRDFATSWAPRVRGWWAVMGCHTLQRAWAEALELEGLYVFAPIPIVIPGMTVRLAGDGPSSWCMISAVTSVSG